MKNNQRKNKKSLVLVAMILMIGLVAGMGAMTYSRYITSANVPTQTATAAKWGFVVTADAKDLFGTDYANPNSDELTSVVATDAGVAVNATTSTGNIVAPGTTGSMTLSIKGSAEVRAAISVEFTLSSDIFFGDYHPIQWQINDGEWMTTEELKTTLNALTQTYIPGTTGDLAVDYTITWKWDLETAGIDNVNQKDTLIGFMANKPAATLEEIKEATGLTLTAADIAAEKLSTSMSFSLVITIKQVQA